MIEYEGNNYVLKFNMERLRLVERALKKPIITIYTQQNGAFSIDEMEIVFTIALKREGSDVFCSNKIAKDVFNYAVKDLGYAAVNDEITETLQEDCPFLLPSVS